ncbi:MAG: peptidase fungalysin, partial [Nocardioides sp.]|uniref:M36 family metallopeptidase n=1 Tax=Nocardioides sp. TaxID=35761 RepID=UPI002637436B
MTQPSPRRATALLAAGMLTITLVPGLMQLPASSAASTPAPVVEVQDVITPGDPVAGLQDFADQQTAQPSLVQRQAADQLGAVQLRWNSFGTPASILPTDGSLGAAPGSPADGARTWLRSNAAVFGLTSTQVDGLTLVNSQELARDDSRAVLFRQEFGGLASAENGLVTVGVDEGKVFYVSSSLVPATGTPAAATLSPLDAWLAAASSVGLGVTSDKVADIVTAKSGGWTRLGVPGFAQEQQVRLRSLPLAGGSVRPVYEANVVNVAGGAASAYTVLIDAATGKDLVRRNQVDNMEDTQTFQGTVTSTACAPPHPFTLTDGATRQINAVAIGSPTDDFVVKILDKNGNVLAANDLATNPEVVTYAAASIPQDEYAAQVCPFDDASIVVGQYSLTVNTTNTAAPSAGSIVPTPRWRYFLTNPTLDNPTETPTNSVIGCWSAPSPVGECSTPPGNLENIAAFGPWDTVGAAPTFTTIGNNANTHEAWASPLTPGGTAQAPYSPTRSYTDEFTDAWNNSECDPTQLRPGGNDINASVTALFASHNRMHDYSYYLGFTEKNYNMQSDNGSRGGVGGDPEIGNAQAGAINGGAPSYLGRDNANQVTLQDGTPGITNQYLFQPIAGAFYAPCTDGGLDMGIVGHEYTHAITNRMVGGPDQGLTSEQGGAMGESWGDLVAGEYQFSHGYGNGGNIWAVGAYATGNLETAIRDYAINDNPLNFSQYGFDTTGPEVHADGEIWNGTMWEVRQALVEKYDAQYPYADK